MVDVATASDPVEAGRRAGISVSEDRIAAVVVYTGSDASFLKQLGVVIAGTTQGRAQVTIPLGRLCDVGTLEQVVAVQRVQRAVAP